MSPETIQRSRLARAFRSATDELQAEQAARPPERRAAGRARGVALLLAAELAIFAAGFAAGEAARAAVSSRPAGACVGCEAHP